jgi:hypothetical protein
MTFSHSFGNDAEVPAPPHGPALQLLGELVSGFVDDARDATDRVAMHSALQCIRLVLTAMSGALARGGLRAQQVGLLAAVDAADRQLDERQALQPGELQHALDDLIVWIACQRNRPTLSAAWPSAADSRLSPRHPQNAPRSARARHPGHPGHEHAVASDQAVPDHGDEARHYQRQELQAAATCQSIRRSARSSSSAASDGCGRMASTA